MPNWMHTTMKIRGTEENLILFINDLGALKITKDEEIFENSIIETKINENYGNKFINHFNRSHITEFFQYNIEGLGRDVDDYIVIFEGIDTAWSHYYDDLSNVAKKYNVKIKLHGYEFGCFFEHIKEWDNKGSLIRNDEKTLRDDEDDEDDEGIMDFIWETERAIDTSA